MMPCKLARERGQSMVVVALLMLVLVGFLAMVVDVGNVYAQRRFMQNAADAGALAGARALALNQNPVPVVEQYAKTLNGAQVCETTVVSPSVYVTVSKTCPTYFASVIGYPRFVVQASAQARFSAPSTWGNSDLVPVAVHKDAIRYSPAQTLIWDSSTTDDVPKNPDDYPVGWNPATDYVAHGAQRGWLDLDRDGSLSDAELKNWIQFGFHGQPIRVGDWIPGDPGSRSSALQAMNDYRKIPGEVVICPVYDDYKDSKFHVCSFAAFEVTAVNWKGYFKYILGNFKYYVAPEDQEGGGSYDAGVRVIDLVQ